MSKPLELFKVPDGFTVREAIRKMDEGGLGFICVVDALGHVIGVVSDGDFRRAVLKGLSLDSAVSAIMNRQFQSLKVGFTEAQALDLVMNTVAQHIPVLDHGELVGLVNVEDFLPKGRSRHYKENCLIPLVVMAGGQGTRLAPFTNILPKPLMPLGEKPVIEHILYEFASFGIQHVIVSINHKAKIIKAYFEESTVPYDVRFVMEDKPLGTAGALRLIKDFVKVPFFMTNCDVLVKENYWEIYGLHQEKGFDVTMVVAAKKYVLPYGVCRVQQDGHLDRIEEKPELNFLVNTGVYVISPSVLSMIPEGEKFNMDDLITLIQKKGGKVGVFPIDERSFVDIGQLDEYKATLHKIGVVFNAGAEVGGV